MEWRISVLTSLLVLLLSPARAATPDLTEAELERLKDGEIVQRMVRLEGDVVAGRLLGVIEIEADSGDVWAAVLDYEERASTSGAQVSRYRDEWSGGDHLVDLHYELPVFMRTVEYHLQHRYDPDEPTLSWTLDPGRTNDVALIEGSFSTVAGSRPGTTVLVYEGAVDTGKPIPVWVETFLLKQTFRDFLASIRDRAEVRRS